MDEVKEKTSIPVVISETMRLSGLTYTLVGMTAHLGEDNAGHYIAIVPCDVQGQWQILSDKSIGECRSLNDIQEAKKSSYTVVYSIIDRVP